MCECVSVCACVCDDRYDDSACAPSTPMYIDEEESEEEERLRCVSV